ncbi:MAG: chemotaxis protein CheX [Desulfobacteraceae bacterium]|jgi:CheY-specific phosphatase CheX
MNFAAMKLAMKDSIFNVIEQMFFLPIEVRETNGSTNTGLQSTSLITAGVGFNGPSDGMFMLSIPEDLATSMAIDFLGISPEVISSEQITGTVKEMINMLAGSTLSAYEPEAAFNLQIPKIIAASKPTKSDSEPERPIVLLIETPDSRMAFRLAV